MASTPSPSAASKPEPEKTEKLYKKPAFWAILGGLVALWMLSTTFVGSWSEWREQKAVLVPAVPKPVTQEKEVIAVGWIDQGIVEEGKHFRLWVSFENRSDSPALGLRFRSFQIPGFHPGFLQVQGVRLSCWRGGGPACRPEGAGVLPQVGLPARLEKGQSASVFAVLVPSTGHRQFGASGIFTWRDGQGREHEGAVVVPPVPVVAQDEQFWSSLGKMALLLKDLLLPAALAYLAWYLKHRDDKQKQLQDEEKAAKQKAESEEKAQRLAEEGRQASLREAEERKEEKKRLADAESQASLSATWRLMLPKSHTNAERHYMPVVSAIDGVLFEFNALSEDKTEERWRRLLFELLRFLRRMRYLAQEIGGLYFKDRKGEKLAVECWSPFFQRSRDALGPEDRDRALDNIQPNESLATFCDKLSGRPAEPSLEGWARAVFSPSVRENAQVLARLDTRLREWVGEGGFERNLPLLELLSVVLAYEMNRTYELWYGEKMSLDEGKFQAALERLASEPDLQGLASAYLEKERTPAASSATPEPIHPESA